MRFCPSCNGRLRKSDADLVCPKCGHSEGAPDKPCEQGPKDTALNVLEEEGAQDLPTVSAHCEKCGNGEAVWWMLQTRSADEATTQFYRCTKCGHTWRNYD